MRLPFARKPKPQERGQFRNNSFTLNRKSDKTIRRRKQSRFRGTVSALGKRSSAIFTVIGFILLMAILYSITTLLTSDTFEIKDVKFVGNSTLSDAELSAELEAFIDRNIFLTRSTSIETALLESELYFEEVKVQKFLPDQIRVTLRERQPNITLINFSGAYLVDDDGTVVEIISEGKVNLSTDDIDIIKGLGNPNADYVKQRYILDNRPAETQPEQEQEDTPPAETDTQERQEDRLDFTKVPLSQKVATLDRMRSELLAKASEIHSNYSRQASETVYAGLPRVYVYANNQYQINNHVDLPRLELTKEARTFFAAMDDFIVERVTWESPYIVTFSFTNGKNIKFGTTRDYGEQLDDFSIIHEQLRIKGQEYVEMDLSSSKVSVK